MYRLGTRYIVGMRTPFSLHQLHQRSIRRLRMYKNGPSLRSNAGLLIQHGNTLLLHLRKRGIDILDLKADMVQALAAFLQELRQAGVRGGRLNQLDFASAGAAYREKGDTHLFRWHLFYF